MVKSTFEKLGGAIDLETNLGTGTKVIIHLPTTLTIMSSLIVRIEGDRYGPHSELKEVILVRPEDEIQIEKIRDRISSAGNLILFFQWKRSPESHVRRKRLKVVLKIKKFYF